MCTACYGRYAGRAGKPASAENNTYDGDGHFEQTSEGWNVYVSNPSGKVSYGIVMVYDIFGCVPAGQYKRVCDMLAQRDGYCVACPDLLGQDAWPESKFPPPDQNEFGNWLESTASFQTVSPGIESARKLLHSKGASKVGLIGHCWGAARAFQQAADGKYAAVAACHPAEMLTTRDVVANCPVPSALLLSKDESEMTEQRNAQKEGSEHHAEPFKDCVHGWMAARADFSDEKQVQKAIEGANICSKFFAKHLEQ